MSLLMVSPPGGGKTKREYISTIRYNAEVNRRTNGKGASMIITDVKGEEEATCRDFLIDAGYNVLALDFRHPLYSYRLWSCSAAHAGRQKKLLYSLKKRVS